MGAGHAAAGAKRAPEHAAGGGAGQDGGVGPAADRPLHDGVAGLRLGRLLAHRDAEAERRASAAGPRVSFRSSR